ncbi:MAG: exonuclease domain-containing protein [Acholeplasmataceae bacterium]
MRKIIDSVDSELNIFYIIIEGRKIGFHLTKRLAKTFFHYLDKGIVVDFEVSEKRKKIEQQWLHQVAYFNKIESLHPHHVFYDLAGLRNDMKTVLEQYEYFLFIDFEMTMPGYQQKKFTSEIIQVGYVLSKAQSKVLVKDAYYVKPKLTNELSKRTLKFLKIEEAFFNKKAVDYQVFYKKLKKIISKYHPKCVVWGKNDITALNDSYQIHQKLPLTDSNDFIDLLKLHKDYYNLKDDLGLFNAYKTYYESNDLQKHDAFDDAKVTKFVFDAFLEQMK